MDMPSNRTKMLEDVHEHSTSQKVHFGENVVLCQKPSKNGGPYSEPRKSILKRKNLLSSPVQDRSNRDVKGQPSKRMTDKELNAKIVENQKRIEAIKQILRKYECL